MINDIFNGNRILEVPFFQRAYVWETPQWERLLEDMESVSCEKKPYFLGSVILKQKETASESNVGDQRILIDGQQRLTTLNILFKVLCLKLNQPASFDRVFRLMDNSIALLHNHHDIESFNRVLNLNELIYLDGADAITKAYNYFNANLETEKVDFNTILTNIMFVGIDLGKDEDEQQIFDTINSLGVRLTTAELLKNYFYHRENIEQYNSTWKETFEKDADTKEFWDQGVTAGRRVRANIDLFFYSYLQIKINDKELSVNSEDKQEFSKVDGLFNSFKKFISNYQLDKEELINEIVVYASLYRNHVNPQITEQEIGLENKLDRINLIIFGLETTTLIPYILYILKQQETEHERSKVFEYLEAYIMRRMVSHTTNKNYNQLFTERFISNEVNNYESLVESLEKLSDKVNYMPDDSDVKEGFLNSRLINKQSAGILYMIESAIRDSKKQSTGLLGFKHYSLEHLMPKRWENNWNDGTLDAEETIKRNKKLLTMGNLAIITSSLNSSIRDASWYLKVNGNDKRHGLRYFSAGIETLTKYLDYPEWNEKHIQERGEFLFQKGLKIWNTINNDNTNH